MKLLMDYRGKYTISCVDVAVSHSSQNDVSVQHGDELLNKNIKRAMSANLCERQIHCLPYLQKSCGKNRHMFAWHSW